MLPQLVSLWRVSDTEEEIVRANPDAIVAICYGTFRHRLTKATEQNFIRALEWGRRFPEAIIFYGNCPYVFPGAEVFEERFKRQIIERMRPQNRIVRFGNLQNSFGEGFQGRAEFRKLGIHPRSILLVTGEIHSRDARYIWQKLNPQARVSVSTIPYQLEAEPNHPVKAQQTHWGWVRAVPKRRALALTHPLFGERVWRMFSEAHHLTSAA